MPWLDSIEKLHNWASETRFVWFPFKILRPKKKEKISSARRTLMAVCFGVYYSVFIIGKRILFGKKASIRFVVLAVFFTIIVFFLWFSLITTPLWNRRAQRIKKLSSE